MRREGRCAPHRVADEREPLRREACQVSDDGIERDGLDVRRGAVAADVKRQRAVAFSELGDHRLPTRTGVCEAVQKNKPGHLFISS